jgi:hypothetical protein
MNVSLTRQFRLGLNMPAISDEFRQRFLIDVMLLREHHDRIWGIVLAMPPGETRTRLELEHHGVEQLTLNLRKTLMEML